MCELCTGDRHYDPTGEERYEKTVLGRDFSNDGPQPLTSNDVDWPEEDEDAVP